MNSFFKPQPIQSSKLTDGCAREVEKVLLHGILFADISISNPQPFQTRYDLLQAARWEHGWIEEASPKNIGMGFLADNELLQTPFVNPCNPDELPDDLQSIPELTFASPMHRHYAKLVCNKFFALQKGNILHDHSNPKTVEDQITAHLVGDNQGISEKEIRKYVVALVTAWREKAILLQEVLDVMLPKNPPKLRRLLNNWEQTSSKSNKIHDTNPQNDRERENHFKLLLYSSLMIGGKASTTRKALQKISAAEALQPDDPRTAYARGIIYHDLRDHLDDAISSMQLALELSIKQNNYPLRTRILHILANLHRTKGNDTAAMDYLLEAQHELSTSGNIAGEARILDTRGNILMWQGRLTEAKALITRSILLKKQLNQVSTLEDNILGVVDRHYDEFQKGRAISLGNLARAHFFEGGQRHLQKAYDLFSKNIDISKKLKDPRGLVVAFHGRGLANRHLSHWEPARHDFNQAFNNAEKAKNHWGKFLSLTGRLELFIYRRNLEEAQKTYEQLEATSSETRISYAAKSCALFQVLLKHSMGGEPAISTLEDIYWQLKEEKNVTVYFQFQALSWLKLLCTAHNTVPSNEIQTEIRTRSTQPLLGWMLW